MEKYSELRLVVMTLTCLLQDTLKLKISELDVLHGSHFALGFLAPVVFFHA